MSMIRAYFVCISVLIINATAYGTMPIDKPSQILSTDCYGSPICIMDLLQESPPITLICESKFGKLCPTAKECQAMQINTQINSAQKLAFSNDINSNEFISEINGIRERRNLYRNLTNERLKAVGDYIYANDRMERSTDIIINLLKAVPQYTKDTSTKEKMNAIFSYNAYAAQARNHAQEVLERLPDERKIVEQSLKDHPDLLEYYQKDIQLTSNNLKSVIAELDAKILESNKMIQKWTDHNVLKMRHDREQEVEKQLDDLQFKQLISHYRDSLFYDLRSRTQEMLNDLCYDNVNKWLEASELYDLGKAIQANLPLIFKNVLTPSRIKLFEAMQVSIADKLSDMNTNRKILYNMKFKSSTHPKSSLCSTEYALRPLKKKDFAPQVAFNARVDVNQPSDISEEMPLTLYKGELGISFIRMDHTYPKADLEISHRESVEKKREVVDTNKERGTIKIKTKSTVILTEVARNIKQKERLISDYKNRLLNPKFENKQTYNELDRYQEHLIKVQQETNKSDLLVLHQEVQGYKEDINFYRPVLETFHQKAKESHELNTQRNRNLQSIINAAWPGSIDIDLAREVTDVGISISPAGPVWDALNATCVAVFDRTLLLKEVDGFEKALIYLGILPVIPSGALRVSLAPLKKAIVDFYEMLKANKLLKSASKNALILVKAIGVDAFTALFIDSMKQGPEQFLAILDTAKDVTTLFGDKTKIFYDSAAKLGLKTGDKIVSFAQSLKSNPKAIEKVEEIATNIGKSDSFKRAIESVPSSKSMFYVRESGGAIPSTGYKYLDSNSPDIQHILSDGYMPARSATKPHYASFSKYNNAREAMDGLQLAKRPSGTPYNDARYRVEFDTLQHVDEIKVPRGRWGEADYLEPLTKDFPEFGDGGATQIIFNGRTKIKEVVDILTGQKIYPK